MAVGEMRSGKSASLSEHSHRDGHQSLVDALTAQLGSAQEARWIVEHGGDSAQTLADRRASGEPLQYVLGRWPFRSIELQVDRRVLIPRPETEQVVEVALAELRRLCDRSSASSVGSNAGPVVVDLGTGSGAVALSLATEGVRFAPGIEVWATDVSADAAEVARANLADVARTEGWSADRVQVVEGSWFEALPGDLAGRVDLVVSNPPYVAESEYDELDATVRDWEPRLALVAASGSRGSGGMAAIELIITGASSWLRTPGTLVVEISPGQREASVVTASNAGFTEVSVADDLAGRPRTLVARR